MSWVDSLLLMIVGDFEELMTFPLLISQSSCLLLVVVLFFLSVHPVKALGNAFDLFYDATWLFRFSLKIPFKYKDFCLDKSIRIENHGCLPQMSVASDSWEIWPTGTYPSSSFE